METKDELLFRITRRDAVKLAKIIINLDKKLRKEIIKAVKNAKTSEEIAEILNMDLETLDSLTRAIHIPGMKRIMKLELDEEMGKEI